MENYIQVFLNVNRASAELVTLILEEHGALSVTVTAVDDEQQFDVADPREPAWEVQRLGAIFESIADRDGLCRKLEKITGRSSGIEYGILEDRDWERTWLENYRPLEITENLWICPSWCDPPEPDAVNLIMDPGLAFGTGTHETTALCLEYLASLDLDHRNLLDFGCGSGILAIAALLLGAERAIGVDVDSRALQASRDNAVANGIDERFQVLAVEDVVSRPSHYQGDIVIANILAETLIENSEILESFVPSGGELLLSGILDYQVTDVVEEFGRNWHFDQRSKGQWVLLVGKYRYHG